MNEKIVKVAGRGVWVRGDDLDTDQIIPAQFLKCVTFDGLGEYAFYHDRYDGKGTPLEHPLNDERFKGAGVLLSGRNFGCGSSREHAPQALYRSGVRVIIAESFAEIFFGNCTTLGLICVSASRADLERLGHLVEAEPSSMITVNLDTLEVQCGALGFGCSIASTARDALRGGYWDPLSGLLEHSEAVAGTYQRLVYSEWSP
jgi:3-isopropylmalate/(R)-2-methylmalate dehydratase small subunit